MSRHELVNAYISGSINRRAFVRGLTALGVSAGIAASYAVALQPTAAAMDDYDYDYYDGPVSSAGSSFADSDGDGLYDADETGVYGTNPYVYDTDGDGTGDGTEVYYGSDPRAAGGSTGTAGVDSDNDGLLDTDETQVYGTNPWVYDTDGDGVGDGQEVYNGTSPRG
jgi:thrombospondin type 3 repeat protein